MTDSDRARFARRLVDEDASPVPRGEPLTHWLSKELEHEEMSVEDLGSEAEVIEQLVLRKPIAHSIFNENDLDWYAVDLTAEDVRELHVVKGPPDEDWRAVAEDRSIESVARQIRDADDVERLHENVPKDLIEVVELADQPPDERDSSPFVVVQEDVSDAPYVADGNHRAAALVLRILRGEQDGDLRQPAYVGVPSDSVDS
jgi:hypothetical protein